MSSKISGAIFEGVGRIIDEGLSLNEEEGIHQKTVSRCIESIPQSERLLNDLYRQIEKNIPEQVVPNSEEIWKLRRTVDVKDKKYSEEAALERAVALLAEKDYMRGWYNQLPIASGVMGGRTGTRICVDLVHESEVESCFRFVELKLGSDTPLYALFEILRYGLVYLFFRAHAKKYGFEGEEVMNACEVVLEVLAPQEFFEQHNQSAIYASLSPALNKLAKEEISEDFSMSIEAKMFPSNFQRPFKCGAVIKESCGKEELEPDGAIVCNAFKKRAPVEWGGNAGVKV